RKREHQRSCVSCGHEWPSCWYRIHDRLGQALLLSNYGSADVWIAAPGENIISTYPGGTYGSESGTSFSSPLVAGTVALMLSAKQSSLNQSQAANALANAQVLTPDLNHGRLNGYQAVTAWVNGSSSTSSSCSCSWLCF